MTLEKLVRKRLKKYLSGVISLRTFLAWFIPATWDADELKIASCIKLYWAEYTNGHMTELELREHFATILRDGKIS